VNGIVTDIQRFSVHDGPGIRTTVFLKGCNLRCAWCHNPETLRPGPELQVLLARCIGCGACLEACPNGAHEVRADGERLFHRDRCTACGACADVCYAGALVLVGREMTVEEVVAEVLEDRPFYEESGGGVTLSGGEPLVRRDFAVDILRRCRQEGLHTAVETNLAVPWDEVAALLPVTDLFMVDVKLIDAEAHARWTGAPNEDILANLRRLAEEPQPMVVRTPVVPGVNDTPEAIGAVADLVRGLANLAYYELLPYHPLGAGKYESLGMDYALADLERPPHEVLDALAEAAAARGIAVRVAGVSKRLAG
jgi:pyruvate formate lyase activating enzyme